jgi:hypothetical protein
MALPLPDALAQCQRHADVLASAMARMPGTFTPDLAQDKAALARTAQCAMRNALTHEYRDQPQIRAAVLNEALQAAAGMTTLLQRVLVRVGKGAQGTNS